MNEKDLLDSGDDGVSEVRRLGGSIEVEEGEKERER